MGAKLSIPLILLVVGGCAARQGEAEAPRVASASSSPARAERGSPQPEAASEVAPAAEVLAQAERAFDSQLGASRGQFDVERQVAVLKEAVLLYQQFLERADGRPELEPAVRKSRERIADAKATIEFLEASLKAEPGAGRQ